MRNLILLGCVTALFSACVYDEPAPRTGHTVTTSAPATTVVTTQPAAQPVYVVPAQPVAHPAQTTTTSTTVTQ